MRARAVHLHARQCYAHAWCPTEHMDGLLSTAERFLPFDVFPCVHMARQAPGLAIAMGYG